MCNESRVVNVFGHIVDDLTTEYWNRAGWAWHEVAVDACISEDVRRLNEQGIYTLAACCGHGDHVGDIAILEEDVGSVQNLGYKVGVAYDGWPWAAKVR